MATNNMIKKHMKTLSLLFIFLLSVSGCAKEPDEMECPFFGTWNIEKVAMISEKYTGMASDGDSEKNTYDAADFVGCELKYGIGEFQLDGSNYNVSQYVITYQTVEEFYSEEKLVPDFYTFLEEEDVKINNLKKYTEETLLLKFDVGFRGILYQQIYDYHESPAEIRCVLLNDDTMIIEIWGKILLAYRAK